MSQTFLLLDSKKIKFDSFDDGVKILKRIYQIFRNKKYLTLYEFYTMLEIEANIDIFDYIDSGDIFDDRFKSYGWNNERNIILYRDERNLLWYLKLPIPKKLRLGGMKFGQKYKKSY